MPYITKLVEYHARDKIMAEEVEKVTNRTEQEGYELVTLSITNNGRAILVFKETTKK